MVIAREFMQYNSPTARHDAGRMALATAVTAKDQGRARQAPNMSKLVIGRGLICWGGNPGHAYSVR